MGSLERWFVERVYTAHSRSRSSLRLVDALLDGRAQQRVLNIGSGARRYGDVVNLDVAAGIGVHVVADAQAMPFRDASFSGIISQEVIEHLPDPAGSLLEAARVAAPGAWLFLQTPFVMGYHPQPEDHWRFSRTGLGLLLDANGWTVEKSGITVGPADATFFVLVEFFALLLSRPVPKTYRLAKALAATALLPLRLLRPVLSRHPEAARIAGGFYVVARLKGPM